MLLGDSMEPLEAYIPADVPDELIEDFLHNLKSATSGTDCTLFLPFNSASLSAGDTAAHLWRSFDSGASDEPRAVRLAQVEGQR